jgi:hypothetical protein
MVGQEESVIKSETAIKDMKSNQKRPQKPKPISISPNLDLSKPNTQLITLKLDIVMSLGMIQ